VYRRILVATDFSPHAEAVVAQALWTARQAGAEEVLVAHVLADLRKAVHETSYLARMELLHGDHEIFDREVRRRSDEQLQALIARHDTVGLRVGYETLLGTPYVELSRAAEQGRFDLVFVGTRGLSAFKRLLVGSTTKQLVRHCPASVWVVKPASVVNPASSGPPRKVLIACDFSDASRRACLEGQQIARWAATQAAAVELHALHVIDRRDVPDDLLEAAPPGTKPRTFRSRIRQAADEHFAAFVAETLGGDPPVERHLEWGTPWQMIDRWAKKLSADLVAMGTVGRSGIAGLLMGNTAERILHQTDASLLIAKPAGHASPLLTPGQNT
jgi:universal stress protein E